MNKFACLAVLFFLISPISFADTTKDSLIEELYIKSGLENQVKDTPETLQLGINAQLNTLDSSNKFSRQYLKNVNGFIEKSFDPKKMEKTIKSILKQEINENEIKTIISWLETPTGNKCTKLEEYYSSPEGVKGLDKYLESIREKPPSESRMQLIKKFESNIKQIDFVTDLTIKMQTAIAVSVAYSVPSETEIDISQIRKNIESLRPQIRETMAPRIISSILYTYHDLTNNELDHYIEFLSSDSGQKYTNAVSAGYERSFTESSLELGQLISDFVKTYNSQTES